MEPLSRKCAIQSRSEKEKSGAEVDLGHFAAIGGLTEYEYRHRMMSVLHAGNLVDLLRFEAKCDVGEWIADRFLSNKEEFLITFRLSANKSPDEAVHCICSIDMDGKEPKIRVKHALNGVIGILPQEAKGLQAMMIGLGDMENRI